MNCNLQVVFFEMFLFDEKGQLDEVCECLELVPDH